MKNNCYHCNEKIPNDITLTTIINGDPKPMCCLGCQAVSQAIIDAKLTSYYDYRTEFGSQQDKLIPSQLNCFSAYDIDEIQQDFIYQEDNISSLSLSITGMTCAACAWLIEHKLQNVNGINKVNINSTTARAYIEWHNQQIKLSQILNEISLIGYQASPYQLDKQEKINKKNSQQLLLRLGLAGLASMQVMMFAFALYAGYFSDIEVEYQRYFHWVSLLFATPVVLYCAQPFYLSAIRGILANQLNMDVSISIAILGAYIASMLATINDTGDIYFESVTMFTFFLLMGRYFEQSAKNIATVHASNLHTLIPLTAHKYSSEHIEEVAAKQLTLEDVVCVYTGETIPTDGVIIKGMSKINEAMLTGEQAPITKTINDKVYAGTINLEQSLFIKVTAVGQNQMIAEIIRLQELAANTKPKLTIYTNKLSHLFTLIILLITLVTYFAWTMFSPENAFWVALSVLVATCPCALALATPTAITCAVGKLTKLGMVIRNPSVVDKLHLIDHVVFDKTGTLTHGKYGISAIENYSTFVENQLLNIAAALENQSNHPIAKVFAQYKTNNVNATSISNEIGQGIQGLINEKTYRIGQYHFVTDKKNKHTVTKKKIDQSNGAYLQKIWLSCNNKILASFVISDEIRSQALALTQALTNHQINMSIASGDPSNNVMQVGHFLGIKAIYNNMSPENKLSYIRKLQNNNHTVAMFGDGINDAPVLKGADISITMGSAETIAKNSADIIFINDDLSQLATTIKLAKKTQSIIKQNFIWAIAYNISIIPLAVLGFVVPYIAALGMSVSSLIVVTNSLRLLRKAR